MAFLIALLRRPEDIKPILSHLTKVERQFFVFNMHLLHEGIIQKYLVAVDDYLPLTQEGSNLFCQADPGDNAILPFLEKAWAKYVYVTKIKDKMMNTECIDRIMLGFLGSPSIKLKTIFKNFVEEFKKHYFSEAYVFCYLKANTKQSKDRNLLRPFILNSYELIMDKPIYFLQSEEGNCGLDNTDDTMLDEHLQDRVKYYPYTSGNTNAKEKGLFFLNHADFVNIFETVFICMYKRGETCRYHSVSVDQVGVEGGRFEVE